MRKWKWLSPIAVLILWQLLAAPGWLGRGTPTPVEVAVGLYQLAATGFPPGYRLPGHVLASLVRVLFGFGAAALVAVPLGILMGWSRTLDAVVDPLVEAVRPVPPLAWLPLAVTWFGIGYASASFLIFLGALFPILLNTITGVRSVDPHLVEAARTLGAGRRTVLVKVLAPGALPSVTTGLRIGMGIAWMTVIAAELTGVKSGYGLGYLIMSARDVARMDYVVAGIVVIGIVGFLLDRLIRCAERRALRWR